MSSTESLQPNTASLQISCCSCGKTFDGVFQPFCDQCGNITDVRYDLDQVQLRDSDNPYLRFQDLLPVRDKSLLPTDMTYTPVIHAQTLGKKLGMPNLYLKDETTLPSKTTKDRMAAVALPYLYECGVRTFCSSSTGNSSTAFSRAIPRFDGMNMFLFTASDFRNRVQFSNHPNITHYIMRDATFAEASNYSCTFAQLNGFVPERGFFNLARREGLKLSFLEATEQIPQPINWYVQAISSAMGVFGVYKGAGELQALSRIPSLPRLLCVQQDTCAPMVRAWNDDAETIEPEHIFETPTGIAEAILRGNPTRTYPHIRRIVKESDGNIVGVSEKEIREARTLVEELEGLSPCFAASTAVAGLIKEIRREQFPLNDTVLISLTGGERSPAPQTKPADNIRWLYQTENGWLPEEPDLEGGLVQSGNS